MDVELLDRALFDAVLAQSDVEVPPQLREGVYIGFVELRGMARLLRSRHDPHLVPADVFRATRDLEG